LSDLRLAIRSLRATPIVTAVAILSLALGIGANTAIFSLVDSLILRALPVREPRRLVFVTDTSPSHVRVWSYPVWKQIHDRPELFEHSAAWSFTQLDLATGGESRLIPGIFASSSFFETLGAPALLGRTFSGLEDRAGSDPVAVISYGFWQRSFAGAPDIIGRSVSFDNVRFTIIGVTPSTFFGPEVGRTFDAVVPLEQEPVLRGRDSFLDDSGITFLTIIARLRPDQSTTAATASLRGAQPAIREATLGDIGRFGSRASVERYLKEPFVLAPGATGYAGARDLRVAYQRPLVTMLGIVMFLLCIACGNVANLQMARAAARRAELSLRLALGASRERLVHQLFMESATLAGIGTACGLALAMGTSRILVHQLSTTTNTIALDLTLDRTVLAFTIALGAMTALLFGTAPAFITARTAPIDALKRQERSVGRERGGLASGLIVMQVAFSLVLVVAGGLFIRTFILLSTRPLGFAAAPVLIVNIDAHRTTNDAAQRIRLYNAARDAVRRLPSVDEAALSLTTPVGSGQFTPRVEVAGVSDSRGPVWANLVSPGWLTTFQTPLIAGRDLTDADRAGAPRVALVNETFVRTFMPGGRPIGATITLYPGTVRSLGPIEIVGVVEDAIYSTLRAAMPPTYYLPLAQFDYLPELGIRSITLSVRSRAGSPMLLTRSITTALAVVNPQLTLTIRPLADQVNGSLVQERVVAILAGCFGGLALLLAALGLYGVTAYGVARRRGEIGIRMALGAAPAAVMELVLSRVALLVAAGIVIGAVVSAWASKFIATLLYGVQPRDPVTFVGAAAILAAVGAIAGWLPAWRASRIDPAEVLREA
jgi:predicted permease